MEFDLTTFLYGGLLTNSLVPHRTVLGAGTGTVLLVPVNQIFKNL